MQPMITPAPTTLRRLLVAVQTSGAITLPALARRLDLPLPLAAEMVAFWQRRGELVTSSDPLAAGDSAAHGACTITACRLPCPAHQPPQ
jgi:hypothetical protein